MVKIIASNVRLNEEDWARIQEMEPPTPEEEKTLEEVSVWYANWCKRQAKPSKPSKKGAGR